MKKNELYQKEDQIERVLFINEDIILTIDCKKMTMPEWRPKYCLKDHKPCTEEKLYSSLGYFPEDMENITPKRREVMYKRYTIVAAILPFIMDNKERQRRVSEAAEETGLTKQTIRTYLCRYLAVQDIRALLPMERDSLKELTDDEKNMRWSLNKFFYTTKKNTLNMAYTLMLKERYCDVDGKLIEKYPSFYQYRYFYRKTRKMQNFYISRDGLTNYQRNNRPCIGDGVQEYAPVPGVGMVDATPCDIYLVNDNGEVVGRPILTACVDAYSGLCCGYSLSWEGGIYSLRSMMLNVTTDKAEYCKLFGITITDKEWPNAGLPGKIISDQGSEYIGYTFEQLTELGVTIVNLPSYRPELKGVIEKFFDLVQEEYKPHLKGKGVIEPDFQERGAHDYRKDACLTMEDFQRIMIRCVIYYNSKHIIENYPFTPEMLAAGVKPYACNIYLWGLGLPGVNIIRSSKEEITLCLLPRVVGRFGRYGLKVNKLRYHRDGYTEDYLTGKEAVTAYDPDNVSYVWLVEKGVYIRFDLIESRYAGMKLSEVEAIQQRQRGCIRREERNRRQADIELANHIQIIADSAKFRTGNEQKNMNKLRGIRDTRKKEENLMHREYAKEVGLYDRK